ncbi:MAG: hypothetical protein V3U75_04715 [Methylococcaceae bacterium]
MSKLKIGVLITTLLFILNGCSATLMTYQPKELTDINSAMLIIKDKMDSIPCQDSVKFVPVTERFIKLDGRFNDGLSLRITPHKAVGRITLHKKMDSYILTVSNSFGGFEYRCYLQSEIDAKLLVDSLHTMMKHKPDQYNSEE